MIIIDSVTPVEHGRGSVRSKFVLFADTKYEVPGTGSATAAMISELEGELPPTTILYTADFKLAVLGNDDKWHWNDEEDGGDSE